jgi:2-amino-4-deoxychorismate synthase
MIARLTSLLNHPAPPPFAVLRRANGPGVELFFGDVVDVDQLADIPLPDPSTDPDGPRVLALVPYRQIAERGFTTHDDATPLRCLLISDHVVLDPDEVLRALPPDPVELQDIGFDVDDDAYAGVVADVIRNEIGRGAGANFVIRRDYQAQLTGSAPHAALRLFRRLLAGEPNAYWTFAVHAGEVTMVGATPERHVSVTGDTVVMNPISGTYRSPVTGPTADGLLRFLDDPKETDELFMVVDEELKMMSHICEQGGQVLGPYLKEVGHVVHTEYLLEGQTELDVRTVLRETMFAPTVTGSPIENAARVITRHEAGGRGYYAGVAALIGHDDGRTTLDAPILIRTAYLEPDGRVRVPVGATLVRHSVPEHEVAETHAKAAGMLSALGLRAPRRIISPTERLADHPDVSKALSRRNAALAPFWLRRHDHDARPVDAGLTGRRALIIDAEDRWTMMLAHLLRRIGMTTEVRRWDEAPDAHSHDLLIAGPGPGDPRDRTDPRIRRLREIITARLAASEALLAVCLSHQILADILGFPLAPLPQPHQGKQRKIEYFGRSTLAGFYNTFAAYTPESMPAGLNTAVDPETGELNALRGEHVASVQFHMESILSTDGIDLVTEITRELIGAASGQATPRGRN